MSTTAKAVGCLAFVVFVLVALAVVFLRTPPSIDEGWEASAFMDKIIGDLESTKAQTGSYPSDIDDLVRRRWEKAPALIRAGDWSYTARGGGYDILIVTSEMGSAGHVYLLYTSDRKEWVLCD